MLSSALAQASAAGVSVGSISDFGGIFDIAAYVLIALGAFSLVVAVLGCAGACCSVKVLLAIVSIHVFGLTKPHKFFRGNSRTNH